MAEPVDVVWDHGYDASALLRELVTARTGSDPGPLHHLCPTCGSVTHGRPSYDAPVHVSIARADDLVVVALCLDHPVGVDITPNGPGARSWARTEALAKAHGTGIVVEHDQTADGIWIQDLELLPGYTGAIAWIGAGLSDQPAVRATQRPAAKG